MANSVVDIAKTFLLAKSRFNRAYLTFWVNEVKPCSDDMAWKVLELLRQEVELFVFKYQRGDEGIKQAAWEIFRLQLVGDATYNFEDAMGFVKWYESIKNKIAQAIGHLYDFHGDSFSDLCDSYPLTGRKLVERALATHPKSNRPRREGYLDDAEILNAVLEQIGPRWHKLISCGENYIVRALEIACKRCFLHRVLTDENELAGWMLDEQREMSYAGEDW